MNYTQYQLEAAFNKVKNSEDWKNRIHSFCRDVDVEVTRQAIRHFTGTEATFECCQIGEPTKENPIGEATYIVKAIGYRMGPCGDY